MKYTGGQSPLGLFDRRRRARIVTMKLIAEKVPAVIKIYIKQKDSLSCDEIGEVNGLINYVLKFETPILLNVWRDLLNYMNARSLILLSRDFSLDVEMDNITALKDTISM